MSANFWETKRLDEMSDDEWESLCDGCARCCLHTFQDIDDDSILYTSVACALLDTSTCRCSDYARRSELVLECVHLTPRDLSPLSWLPKSCAYKRVHEGRGLAPWHPLVSGDPLSIHDAGISIRDWVLSERELDDEEDPCDFILGEVLPGDEVA